MFHEFRHFLVAAALCVLVAAALCAFAATSVAAQEQQQSLGDVARQSRKAKADQAKLTSTSKSVITEDSLSSTHAAGMTSTAAPENPNASIADRIAAGRAKLDEGERALDQLEPLDRSALVKVALEGRAGDFPGRRAWEDKLFAAKQNYVSHGRELIRETKRVLDEIQSLDPNDKASAKRAQDLTLRARQLMQDAFQTEANFQAVILEGQELTNRAVSH